jgi:diaminopimelate epimerase
MAELSFRKYHGLGNDFVLIDHRHSPEVRIPSSEVIRICDRHFGVGADGIIFLLPSQKASGDLLQDGSRFGMRIINSDGSEPEMCGNGIRCLARFMADLGIPTQSGAYLIETLAGLMVPRLQPDGLVQVEMGSPRLLAGQIPTSLADPEQKVIEAPLQVAEQTWLVTCVNMGNPHAVVFVEDVAEIDLANVGSQFECHPAFPQRVNTEFVQVLDPTRVRMRVWERGAGATLACGTGACAVVVAGVLTGRLESAVTVELPGGSLCIEWNQEQSQVLMTGPAEAVFEGRLIHPIRTLTQG